MNDTTPARRVRAKKKMVPLRPFKKWEEPRWRAGCGLSKRDFAIWREKCRAFDRRLVVKMDDAELLATYRFQDTGEATDEWREKLESRLQMDQPVLLEEIHRRGLSVETARVSPKKPTLAEMKAQLLADIEQDRIQMLTDALFGEGWESDPNPRPVRTLIIEKDGFIRGEDARARRKAT